MSRHKVSLFQPLRHKRFRDLCLANFVSNLGTWMQTFAATWLVASISSSPSTTALVQAAMNAPIFLFSLLGGALADRIDRPKFLFFVHLQMALSAAAMAAYAFAGGRSVAVIVALTFLIGIGAALRVSAWQASMSGLVEPDEIESAATLNGLSFNLASVVGPGLGGIAFAYVGAASLFMANALSFVALLAIYFQWWESEHEVTTTRSAFFASLREGAVTALSSQRFRSIVMHAALFLFGTSAFTTLLPLFVRDVLRLESSTYGALMGSFGMGAVSGALLLPTFRARFTATDIVYAAVALYALLLLSMVVVTSVPALVALMAIGGAAWAAILSSLNAAAQATFRIEVRARALSIFFLANAAGLSIGSVFWGFLADRLGTGGGLGAAGAYLLVIVVIARTTTRTAAAAKGW